MGSYTRRFLFSIDSQGLRRECCWVTEGTGGYARRGISRESRFGCDVSSPGSLCESARSPSAVSLVSHQNSCHSSSCAPAFFTSSSMFSFSLRSLRRSRRHCCWSRSTRFSVRCQGSVAFLFPCLSTRPTARSFPVPRKQTCHSVQEKCLRTTCSPKSKADSRFSSCFAPFERHSSISHSPFSLSTSPVRMSASSSSLLSSLFHQPHSLSNCSLCSTYSSSANPSYLAYTFGLQRSQIHQHQCSWNVSSSPGNVRRSAVRALPPLFSNFSTIIPRTPSLHRRFSSAAAAAGGAAASRSRSSVGTLLGSNAKSLVDIPVKPKPRRYFDLKTFKKFILRYKQREEEAEEALIKRAYTKPLPEGWTVLTFLEKIQVGENAEDIASHFDSWESLANVTTEELQSIEGMTNQQRRLILRHIRLYNHGLWPDNSYEDYIDKFQAKPLANEGKEWTEADDARLLQLAEQYDVTFGDPWLYISWEMQRDFEEVQARYEQLVTIPKNKKRRCEVVLTKCTRPLFFSRYFKLLPSLLYVVPSRANFNTEPVKTFSLPSRFAAYRRPDCFHQKLGVSEGNRLSRGSHSGGDVKEQ
ncbi:homeodomain-like containing protein [Cystoisospora suis]|uniref:Homeodomain-like containing protein n=1 Tax=Cystoisospora suis TaxID=483139 RepID=A0A2C6L682_9APIC|nr:homeodomain-like containing protein [Cystoisospora suis]